MFLFASIPWSSALMWFAVVAALMLANETARASRRAALALFVALPVVLTIFVWPIIAYDLWNFAYVDNCVGDHAFYAGAALLVSCTIPAFWMMFTMAVPSFVTDSKFAVASSHSTTALFLVSAISLAANIAVVVYQVRTIVVKHRNPLKDELYVELAG